MDAPTRRTNGDDEDGTGTMRQDPDEVPTYEGQWAGISARYWEVE